MIRQIQLPNNTFFETNVILEYVDH